MLRHPREVRIESAEDVSAAIEGVVADRAPRILVRNGRTVAIIVSPEDYAEMGGPGDDTWGSYDADLARKALQDATGALAGVDTGRLLRDIREARGQDSTGRSD